MEGMQMKKALVFGLFLGIMIFAVHALTAEAAVDAKSGIAGTVTWRAEPGSCAGHSTTDACATAAQL